MQNGLLNFIQTFFKNSLLLLVYIHFFIVFYYYKFFSLFYLALFKYPRLAVSLTILFSFILLDIYIPIDLWELFFKLLNSTHRSFLSFFFLMIFGLVVFLFLMALFFLFVTLPHFIFLLQTNYMLEVYIIILESISIFLPFLLAVAYLTLMERKVLGSIQLRRGPDIVGPFGILQPISDAFKLVVKELVAPYVSNKPVFMLAPILTFFFAFFGLIMLPFYHFHVVFDMELSLMLFFGLSTLGVYGIILAGWASNSRYAFLGSLRSTAQLISYEVSLGLVIQTVALPCSSVAFVDIVNFQILHG
jgi:NADH dehydrogenase